MPVDFNNEETWKEFIDWIRKTHHLTVDWFPNKATVELWEEFKKEKTRAARVRKTK